MAQATEASVASHDELLQSFWKRGLTGTSTKEQKMLATELSGETGLSIVQIQVSL